MSKIKEAYHEEITRGILGGDEDYLYEEWQREEHLKRYPHIATTAAKRPENIGYEAGTRGRTVLAEDIHFLSWVTAKQITTGRALSVDDWIDAAAAWTEGNREGVADRERIEWEEEIRAGSEIPEWTRQMYA